MPADARRQRTIVFDLDDTLYPESAYVRSGLAAVAALVERLTGRMVAIDMLPSRDPLDAIIAQAGLPATALDSLLWAYRLHSPVIEPRPGVRSLLAACRRRGEAICILTDGRAVTQRLKLAALRIDADGVFISEELGAAKPSPIGYAAIEAAFPAADYVYVGDNPAKDFIAANRRNWRTIGMRPDDPIIHAFDLDGIDADALPQTWVRSFAELSAVLAPVSMRAAG